MTVRFGINGFGRIGRALARIAHDRPELGLELVQINDPATPGQLARLLRLDTVHGRFPAEVEAASDAIVVAGRAIPLSRAATPEEIDWSLGGPTVVLEATGRFRGRDLAAGHLGGAVAHVVVSATVPDADVTLCLGINDAALDRARHRVISNASCTTNCLAPVAKVLNDAVGIETGFMTTIHAYTGDQPTLDTMHKDLYRGRAAALSMIPTSTGAAKAVGLVLPELNGKLDGVAIRVPTPNVSVIDFKFVASRKTDVGEINKAVKLAAANQLKGILGWTDQPNVSIDFNHDPHSSTFHMDQTKVMDGTLVRVMSWYDNEWGFSNRMADTAVAMGKLI